MDEHTPKYTIRIVARMVGLHEQSLRMYERKGLIQPRRSDGNIRLFSDADVDRLRSIKRLVEDLGVNSGRSRGDLAYARADGRYAP